MVPEQSPKPFTRRDFIRQASCAAVGTWALKNTIRDLRLINAAVAANDVSGYKALVCVFLAGGNDANNWIVPTDTATYNEYAGLRGILTLPHSSLLSLNSTGSTAYVDGDGHTYGFHPACPELQTLFSEDKLAVLFNVGTLVRPTTREQYMSGLQYYRPPQLFSHSDQVTQWQTSIPDQPPTTGWGGRCADLLDAAANPTGKVSMSISLNGANTFEIGNLVSQYHVSQTGAVTLSGLSTAASRRIQNILGLTHTNLQRTAYASVMKNAIDTGALLNTSIAGTAEVAQGGTWVWNTPFPTGGLGSQMKMIARLIAARGPSGFDMHRQIFFCSVGGYDTHTNQITFNNDGTTNPITGTHANLLGEVSDCVYAFQRAMEQLGVSNNVTTFTASDFARTFPTNSQGSDHGWGAHHIMVGGAVKGGQTYGHLPIFALNGPQDTGLGRWLPTTAVDQHAATLAKWFGVDDNGLATIFPNLSRFPSSNLGYML